MTQFLAADLGTTSIKLAVISSKGKFIAIRSQRLERFHPNFGWSEQDPKDWWEGFCACSQKVMEDINVDISKLSGIAVCGQMHAPVPLNRNGHLLSNRVQLWDDKRCSSQVINYFAKNYNSESLDEYSNFPASCWSAFKIAWIMDNQPEIYENTSSFLTPKDYINYCLTNRICTDLTEASGSFLLDFQTLKYSKKRAESLEIDLAKFPEIINSDQVIGTISSVASANTGIPTGLPVMFSSAFLLSVILCWNEAFWTLMLTSTNSAPLSVFIASFSSPEGLFWAKLSAASVMAILPIMILGWFSQKQLVAGLTFGAIK